MQDRTRTSDTPLATGPLPVDPDPPSHWGIEPLPPELRKLRGRDVAVLWANLGVGLLVVVTGGFLTAPPEQFGFGLSLPAALVTIVLGSIIGCGLLALGGVVGTAEGRPTMALLRPVLGTKGSFVASALNALQLFGWTAFELWAMALVADLLSQTLFGFRGFGIWLFAFTAITLAFSLWGPLGVVREWMEKFASWILLAIATIGTVYIVATLDLASLWNRGGASGIRVLGVPLDLVIVMPVSWLPLVADYNRYCSSKRGSFWGTFGGYLVSNIWFYLIGAVLLMTPDATATPSGIAVGILAIAGLTISGTLLLAGLLVGESDQAFANVYSGAVSLRNIFPRTDNRLLVTIVTLTGAALASRLSMLDYELFLFLLGSIFIPLIGIWFADYFILKNRTEHPGIRIRSFIPWIAGFLLYHWIAPTPLPWWTSLINNVVGHPLSTKLPWLGASLPTLLLAFLLHLAIGRPRTPRPPT
ncbi:MAG TPA: cytosine permease [Actinomycetota bacterium]|nr:cytosine permease [Actinomycetota bacterium]